MKLTGPEAIPPRESRAREERSGDRLVPVPDPHLKSRPSVRARSRMESIVSSIELMKQAEHCGFGSMPQLNQTGRIEGYVLVQQQVGKLVTEYARIALRKRSTRP